MKYTVLNKRNQPTSFYSDEIHGARLILDPAFKPSKKNRKIPMIVNPDTKIPAAAVEIPEVNWQRHIDGITQVYDPATKTWSDYVPTKAESLASAKSAALAKIKNDYQTALVTGATYSGAQFQSDAKSMSTLAEVLTALANGWTLPAGFAWIDEMNTPHPADTAFLKGLSTAFANHKSALFARLQAAKLSIASATTQTAVSKVVL